MVHRAYPARPRHLASYKVATGLGGHTSRVDVGGSLGSWVSASGSLSARALCSRDNSVHWAAMLKTSFHGSYGIICPCPACLISAWRGIPLFSPVVWLDNG